MGPFPVQTENRSPGIRRLLQKVIWYPVVTLRRANTATTKEKQSFVVFSNSWTTTHGFTHRSEVTALVSTAACMPMWAVTLTLVFLKQPEQTPAATWRRKCEETLLFSLPYDLISCLHFWRESAQWQERSGQSNTKILSEGSGSANWDISTSTRFLSS